MSEQGATKFCVMCKVDLTCKPRTRDKNGKYFCTPCYQKALAAKHERLAREGNAQTGSGTHHASVLDIDVLALAPDESTADVLDNLASAMAAPIPQPRSHGRPGGAGGNQKQAGGRDPRECPVCGHVIPVGAVLCTDCGHNLGSGATLEVFMPGSSRVKIPHRTSTSVYAVLCLLFGALGLLIDVKSMSGWDVIGEYAPALTDRTDFVMILSVLADLGLLAMGALMVLRHPQAHLTAVATFALSMAGHVWWTAVAVMNPITDETELFGSTLAVAGIVIRLLAIGLVAGFYWMVIRHLRQPATRVEFGTK
jgi:hypothetical protein